MTPEQAAALRKPFPPESIGKLPKGGVSLDFVGHAATTERLLAVDPDWAWEPFAVDANGLPAFQNGNLWIKLTICGVTRIGIGDGKSAKECIGDAIRNAAMRFGVAIDLWAKEDLLAFAEVASHDDLGSQKPKPVAHPALSVLITDAQMRNMRRQLKDFGLVERADILTLVSETVGRTVESSKDLTKDEASKVINYLARQLGEAA